MLPAIASSGRVIFTVRTLEWLNQTVRVFDPNMFAEIGDGRRDVIAQVTMHGFLRVHPLDVAA
jgi:hypothetical protein